MSYEVSIVSESICYKFPKISLLFRRHDSIKSRPGRPVTSKAPKINSTRINSNKTAGSESFETFVLILLAETRCFLLENFDKIAKYECANSLRISETRYRRNC